MKKYLRMSSAAVLIGALRVKKRHSSEKISLSCGITKKWHNQEVTKVISLSKTGAKHGSAPIHVKHVYNNLCPNFRLIRLLIIVCTDKSKTQYFYNFYSTQYNVWNDTVQLRVRGQVTRPLLLTLFNYCTQKD